MPINQAWLPRGHPGGGGCAECMPRKRTRPARKVVMSCSGWLRQILALARRRRAPDSSPFLAQGGGCTLE